MFKTKISNFITEWSVEALGQPTNFHSISAPELNSHLEKFYAEAAPRPNEKRSQSMTKQQASEYHKVSIIPSHS